MVSMQVSRWTRCVPSPRNASDAAVTACGAALARPAAAAERGRRTGAALDDVSAAVGLRAALGANVAAGPWLTAVRRVGEEIRIDAGPGLVLRTTAAVVGVVVAPARLEQRKQCASAQDAGYASHSHRPLPFGALDVVIRGEITPEAQPIGEVHFRPADQATYFAGVARVFGGTVRARATTPHARARCDQESEITLE